jgi:predicted  nucleic acid-binding Zn-ribbon protein
LLAPLPNQVLIFFFSASIAILEFEELASTIKRLDVIYSLPRIAAVGDAAHQSISTECVNFNKMGHALQELIDHLEIAVQSTIKVPEDLKDRVHEKLEQTRQVMQRLKDTKQSVELSSTRVMLEGMLEFDLAFKYDTNTKLRRPSGSPRSD